MKTPSLPPKEEWDFSAIDDPALRHATTYEYARTSSLIRSRLCAYLDSKINGKKIRDHIFDAMKAGRWPDDEVSDKVDETVGGNLALSLIILTMKPDFPKPWLSTTIKIKYRRDPAFSRVRELQFIPGAMTLNYPMRGRTSHILDIYWGDANIDEIVSDFEKWLRKEAKVHHDTMKLRGKPGQRQGEPLKWLAAYRLQKAGITFERAQQTLESRKSVWSVPWYADKSGWSRAITKAKSYLAELETP